MKKVLVGIIFCGFTIVFGWEVSQASAQGIVPLCPKGETPTLTAFLALFANIARWILGIIGSLALLMFVWGGFLWVMSAGGDKMVQRGKDTMVQAVTGLLIVLGAWLLIHTVILAIAPGYANWSKVSGELCRKVARGELGAVTEGVQAPTPAVHESRTAAGRAEDHRFDVPLCYLEKAAAETACSKCGGTAVKCGNKNGTDLYKCSCSDDKGRICDASFKKAISDSPGQTKQATCDIACSRDPLTKSALLSLGERLGETPGSKDANGNAYLCCKCAKVEAVVERWPCGQANEEACVGKGGSRIAGRHLCDKGDVITIGSKHYCTIKQLGSVCEIRSHPTGAQAGLGLFGLSSSILGEHCSKNTDQCLANQCCDPEGGWIGANTVTLPVKGSCQDKGSRTPS